MTPELLSDIGISRLRIPIPLVKLQIVHKFAEALAKDRTATFTGDTLMRWLGSLQLESEILEALSIVVLAKSSATVSSTRIRAAILAPSVLSDLFIETAYDSPVLVNSWLKAHSGEAPALYNVDATAIELSRGQIVPGILATRIRALEKQSRRPFLKQWAFEFEQLERRNLFNRDGQFSYFGDGHTHGEVGQFIARRGHIARSAFLRTLAVACDLWDMPIKLAEKEGMFASPVDFSLLPLLPGESPSWVQELQRSRPNSAEECELAIRDLLAGLVAELGRSLFHLHLPLFQDKQYCAEVEVITVLSSVGSVNPEDAFRMHTFLPGQIVIPRAIDSSLILKRWDPQQSFRQDTGEQMRPVLLPIFDEHVGYFHSDLVECMPRLPVNHGSDVPLLAAMRQFGADLTIEGSLVGELHYWARDWRPMHAPESMGHCGTAVTIAHDAVEKLFHAEGMHVCRVWKANLRTRSTDYGEWQTQEWHGMFLNAKEPA